MDNITSITNYLLATSTRSELAAEIREGLFERVSELLADAEFGEAFAGSVEAFVNMATQTAVEVIVESRGDDEVVAAIIASTYAAALSLGIAIATKAAEG